MAWRLQWTLFQCANIYSLLLWQQVNAIVYVGEAAVPCQAYRSLRCCLFVVPLHRGSSLNQRDLHSITTRAQCGLGLLFFSLFSFLSGRKSSKKWVQILRRRTFTNMAFDSSRYESACTRRTDSFYAFLGSFIWASGLSQDTESCDFLYDYFKLY